MMHWLKQAFLSAVAWVWHKEPDIKLPIIVPKTVPSPKNPDDPDDWRFEPKDIEQSGHFYFKKGILDQLENYFICISRMRRMDPESYELYRKVGAHVMPAKTLVSNTMSPRWRTGETPAFGAVCMLNEELDRDAKAKDLIHPKFMYFQKLKSTLQGVQVAPCEIFLCTMFYDDPKDPKLPWGFPITFHCYRDDNRFKLLKELVPVSSVISKRTPTRVGSKTRKEHTRTHVPAVKWAYPTNYMSLFKEVHNRGKDPADTAHMLMCLVSNYHESTNAATRVTVSKGTTNAVFAIDMKRTPYFFKDRDMVKTESGARKRIFHIVRAHRRVRGGIEKYIGFHFRGAREFVWNGYKVLITVPGKHHIDLNIDGPSADYFDKKNEPGWATMGQLGSMIDKHIHKGWGA